MDQIENDLTTVPSARQIDPKTGLPILDNVVVEIDYAIIEHFSKHLYGSPNKAIEELVSNSFDAFATQVSVYIPEQYTNDCVIVWDDGESMDVTGLHKLWWIAQSPKSQINSARISQSQDGRYTRALIGKFGIGKLASYAIGHRITHLCKQAETFLKVSVDYRDVPHLQDGEKAQARYSTPILELTEEEAQDYVSSLFRVPAEAETNLWNHSRWTLAVIDEIKPDVDLKEGRLSWVIGNGMPLRPDFQVQVNGKNVEPKLAMGARTSWDLSAQGIQESLASTWKSARTNGRVEGDYTIAIGNDSEPTAIFPSLGPVKAQVHLFDQSLHNLDRPRSYGFFVMVRERLINPDNPQLSLAYPSFGTFYRSQYIIHADGLDTDLLADRERLHLDTPRTRELGVIIDALYFASRKELDRSDEQKEREGRSEALLPVESRELFRDPLTALQLRYDPALNQPGNTEGSVKPFDPSAARIERAELGEDRPIAALDYANSRFQVNSTHPLLKAIQQRLGGGRKAREAMRALDLFAVSERLLEGYLYDVGLPDRQIEQILDWREGLLRSMALRYAAAPAEEVISLVYEASYKGSKQFELALAKLLELMGFEAARDGASGKKDVLVIAPIGEEEFRFTVEAKGSIHAVGNNDADISGAAAHCAEARATLAVVVAREFTGFARNTSEPPAILKECAEQSSAVSIATVETLVALYKAMSIYHYPLSIVLPILTPIESPTKKLTRIQQLQHPMDNFNFRGILEAIWERQKTEASGDRVAYRTVWQSGPDRWGCQALTDFTRRLIALESLAGGLLKVWENNETVTMYQHPNVLTEHIQEAVERLEQEALGDL